VCLHERRQIKVRLVQGSGGARNTHVEAQVPMGQLFLRVHGRLEASPQAVCWWQLLTHDVFWCTRAGALRSRAPELRWTHGHTDKAYTSICGRKGGPGRIVLRDGNAP
jgi:hypothetical protein